MKRECDTQMSRTKLFTNNSHLCTNFHEYSYQKPRKHKTTVKSFIYKSTHNNIVNTDLFPYDIIIESQIHDQKEISFRYYYYHLPRSHFHYRYHLHFLFRSPLLLPPPPRLPPLFDRNSSDYVMPKFSF